MQLLLCSVVLLDFFLITSGNSLCERLHYCDHGGTCLEPAGVCKCDPGYTGERCQYSIVNCTDEANCTDNQVCVPTISSESGVTVKCVCSPWHYGENCFERKCLTNPCVNGTCEEDYTYNSHRYKCLCNDGYTGQNCDYDVRGESSCQLVHKACGQGGTCLEPAGVCECDPGYTGERCQYLIVNCTDEVDCTNNQVCVLLASSSFLVKCVCSPNHYSLGYGDYCPERQCLSNPCVNGRCEEDFSHTYRYKCLCHEGYTGQNCDNNINASTPYITTMRPMYGPKAGETIITVEGHHLTPEIVVRLGDDIVCETRYANSSVLLAATPKLTSDKDNLIGTSLRIRIFFDSYPLLNTTYGFVYKEDPVIQEVYPRETIKQGGTKLTILGSNLDSVAVITMQTTMVLKQLVETEPAIYNETRTEYTTACTTVNETQLICQTPTIDVPAGFTVESNRKKRNVPVMTVKQSMVLIPTLRSRYIQTNNLKRNPPITKSRVKRNTKIEFSNDGDILEFYIGFNLDGVDDYENYTSISVFVDPTFILDTGVKEHKIGERLAFEGEHLDVGVTVHDYTITVGTADCLQMELLSNSLSCYPPDDQPELEHNNDQDHPRILIHVGVNIKHIAGYLRYPEGTLPLYVIILSVLVPVCVIVLIVVIIVVCLKKRHRTIQS